MAKYDVTYSCGHTATIQLFGKTSERENKIKWLESEGLCPECYKKYRREEDARKAAEILDAAGITLPELTGTENQISYAKSLRNAYIAGAGKEIIYFAKNNELLDEHRDELSAAYGGFDAEYKIYNTKCDLIRTALFETNAGALITALRTETDHEILNPICEKFYDKLKLALEKMPSKKINKSSNKMIIDKFYPGLAQDENGNYIYHGNIESDEAIEINLDKCLIIDGSLKSAQYVAAEHDIEVSGDIEGSFGGVNVRGNVKASGSIKAYGGVDAHGDVEAGGNIESDGDGITAGGNIKTPNDIKAVGGVYAKRNIKVGGNINAVGGIIADGGDIDTRGSIVSGYSVEAHGGISADSIKASDKITSGASIITDNDIESGGNVEAGWSIRAGKGIAANHCIIAGEGIDAGEGINAGRGVIACWDIRAGAEIETGWGIEAGACIIAQTYIDCKRRIFAGTSISETADCKKDIICAELRDGEICYGNLIIRE